jgi:hypothetical protein
MEETSFCGIRATLREAAQILKETDLMIKETAR